MLKDQDLCTTEHWILQEPTNLLFFFVCAFPLVIRRSRAKETAVSGRNPSLRWLVMHYA